MPDCSPTKWHRAHTTWFFETFLLKEHLPSYECFCEGYEVLFNSYYNSVGQQYPRPLRGLISRPGIEEVTEYRAYVDRAMGVLLESANETVLTLVELGLQHEQQHQELLLTDIKHALSHSPLFPVYMEGAEGHEHDPGSDSERGGTKPPSPTSPDVRFVGFEGGRVAIGARGTGFFFDNESPSHDVLVEDFELAADPISNAHVLSFIASGGYADPLLWLSDGWAWVKATGQSAPAYWNRKNPKTGSDADPRSWEHFTLHGRQPIDPRETACHLTYFEADAIARLFDCRLPTEQEWEHAARTQENLSENDALSLEFSQRHLRPGRPATRRPGRLGQLFGSVWEWTQSPYVPYPGFSAQKGAIGEYNGKFMHNQMVLRGGSCATPSGHLRVSYRNFFPGLTSFQFSGARLAKGAAR